MQETQNVVLYMEDPSMHAQGECTWNGTKSDHIQKNSSAAKRKYRGETLPMGLSMHDTVSLQKFLDSTFNICGETNFSYGM